MSNPGEIDATPITSRAALAAYIEVACKTPDEFRIGTEHEKFGFRRADLLPPPYEPDGIEAVLEGIERSSAGLWSPIHDNTHLIGLKGSGQHAGGSVSLEPAGQFELSGAPLVSVHETEAEMAAHFAAVNAVGGPLGLGFGARRLQPPL